MRREEPGSGSVSVRVTVRVGRHARPGIRTILSALDEDLSMMYPGSGLIFTERCPPNPDTTGGFNDTDFAISLTLTGVLAVTHAMEWSMRNFPAMHSQLRREIYL
jgi:hypothetical protein